jgi:GNAT superfamily N-acetyltransferase
MKMKKLIEIKQITMVELDEAAVLFDQYRTFYEQESDLDGARDFLRERLIYRDSVIFAARDKETEQYIGFMQLYPSYSSVSMQRSWILNDLFVREEFRGFGVGKMLLEQAKKYALQTESKGLALTTAVDNHTAQQLYESQGYVKDMDLCQDSRHKFYCFTVLT